MVLGAFRFGLSTSGRGLLLRDADEIAGWDVSGKVHNERVRSEAEFLEFIEATVRGRRAEAGYFVDGVTEMVLPPPARLDAATQALKVTPNIYPATSHTYSVSFHSCDLTRYPGRWSNMGAGVPFVKNSAQDASGVGDGGVQIITDSLGAWTNDCASAVNITYGGETATLKDPNDDINAIVYNDPGNHIAGSWTGSGVVATTFSQGGVTHMFDGFEWVSLSDTDIVFQNGYAGTEPAIGPAMIHEMGHAIGLRHADKDYVKSCSSSSPTFPCSISCSAETACVDGTQECSAAGTAIMTAAVQAAYGYTLKTYDQHAALALYPGGVCANPEYVEQDFDGDGKSDVFWRHGINGQNYLYRMNGQTVLSSTAMPTLDTGWSVAGTGDFNGDLKADIIWRNGGQIYLWQMNGNAILSQGFIGVLGDLNWQIVATADFNNDNRSDILWRHTLTGDNYLYLMNGFTVQTPGFIPQVPDQDWEVAAAADFTGDGKADILWRHMVTGQNYMWTMNGHTQTASNLSSTIADQNWQVAGAGDFSGDGKADILWKNEAEAYAYLHVMNGPSITSQGFIADVADTNWKVATVGDWNGNGKTDLLWRHNGNGDNYMYLMDTLTIVTPGFIPQVPDLAWTINAR
jgi:hypothetical protein